MSKTKITTIKECLWDSRKVYEQKKKAAESVKTGKVISERPDGTQFIQLPDGGVVVYKKGEPKTTAVYGCAVKCEGEFNEENLKEAKGKVLEQLFEIIRQIADAVPEDFFIIHDTERIKYDLGHHPLPQFNASKEEIEAVNYFTVGCKLELPNVYKDEEITKRLSIAEIPR